MIGELDPDEARRSGFEEAEEEAREERRPRPPLPEDHRRERDVALAGAHLPDEPGAVRGREVGPRDPAEDPGDDHGAVAEPGHRDAGAVHRFGRLSDGPQPESEAGPGEHEGDERNRDQRDVDEELVPAHELVVDHPDEGDVRERLRERKLDGLEALGGAEGRGLAAPVKEGDPEGDGEPGREDVHREPADDLVPPVGDAGEAVHEAHGDGHPDRGEEPEVHRSRHRRDGPRRERAPEELPFERDVDDPGALREKAREGAEDERGREPQGGVQGQEELERELVHAGASPARGRCMTAARSRASGGFSM